MRIRACLRITSHRSDLRFSLRCASGWKECDWIQKRLADTAVIQGEPQYLGYVGRYTGYRGYNGRHELFTSLIADFAQRPQALGWPYIASELVPQGQQIVKQRWEDLEAMLSATQAETILAVARKYGVTHIYVGPYEQSLHPGLLSTLAGAPQRFEQVYSANGVHIFFVVEGAKQSLPRCLTAEGPSGPIGRQGLLSTSLEADNVGCSSEP